MKHIEYPTLREFIKLDYSRTAESPSRIFQSFQSVLSAFELHNQEIVKAIDPFLEIEFYIDRIEESSIIVWLLKKILTPDYDELLVKPEIEGDVPKYLKESEEALVEEITSEENPRIGNSSLNRYEEKVVDIAKRTGVSGSANFKPPSKIVVAQCLDTFSKATQLLASGEKYIFKYHDEYKDVVPFQSEIDINQLRIDLTKKEVVTHDRRQLMVKIADFLGKSKWKFRYQNRTIEANILDEEWLDKFHSKQDIVAPGDSLEADIEQIDYYDDHKNKIDSVVKILKVVDVHEGTIKQDPKS